MHDTFGWSYQRAWCEMYFLLCRSLGCVTLFGTLESIYRSLLLFNLAARLSLKHTHTRAHTYTEFMMIIIDTSLSEFWYFTWNANRWCREASPRRPSLIIIGNDYTSERRTSRDFQSINQFVRPVKDPHTRFFAAHIRACRRSPAGKTSFLCAWWW